MPSNEDIRLSDTRELNARRAELERHKRFAGGDFGQVKKARLVKKLQAEARELGAFTPEKIAELTVVKQILEFRLQADALLQQAKAPTAVPSLPASLPQSADMPWKTEADYTLESKEEVKALWEKGFAEIVQKEKEGEYGQKSTHIWGGIMAMHDQLHWHTWPIETIAQNHANKPLLMHISPTDRVFGGERMGINTCIQSPGLNAHGAQQYNVTDKWAGISMVRALSHHLATNHRLEETDKFRSEEGIRSPEFAQLRSIIDSDAIAIYAYGLEHASGGKFLYAVKDILAKRGLRHRDQVQGKIDMGQFLAEARSLDALFTDELPKSPSEIRERLFAYGCGLAFLLNTMSDGIRGEPYSGPGMYNSKLCGPTYEKETIAAYYRMFLQAQRQPVETVQEKKENVEKSLGERTLEWWAQARDAIADFRGEQRRPLSQNIAGIRDDLPRATKLSMRTFEAMVAVDRWSREIAAQECIRAYPTLPDTNPSDEGLQAIRQGIQQLVEGLQFQAFHDTRLEELSEREIQELLLTVTQAICRLSEGHFPDFPEKDRRFHAAAWLSADAIYTVIRESASQKMRQAVEKFHGLSEIARHKVTPHNGSSQFHSAVLARYENKELAVLGSLLQPALQSSSAREKKMASAAFAREKNSFTYISEEGEGLRKYSLVVGHDPQQLNLKATAIVLRSQLPDGYHRSSILPNFEGMPDPGLGVIRDHTGSVYGFTAVGSTVGFKREVLRPQTWAPNLQADIATVRDVLPVQLQERRRQMGIICPDIPENIRARTVFVEHGGCLYARCPSPAIAAHYGQPLSELKLPPNNPSWLTVKLKTIKELEAEYLKGNRVHGEFFPGDAPRDGTVSHREPRNVDTPHTDSDEGGDDMSERRMRAIRDALLRNRVQATFSYDSVETGDEALQGTEFNFSQAPTNGWVVIDLPEKGKQIFVSNGRTYIYPGIQPVADYLRQEALTPRQLQAHGAKQIFWNTPEQFEASITQAIMAETLDQVDAGSVEGLVENHAAYVRGKLQNLVDHINAQPGRKEFVSLETLTPGAVRGGVKSGQAKNEAYCGHTIIKDLARKAGYEDPIPYEVLPPFFRDVIKRLCEMEQEAPPNS